MDAPPPDAAAIALLAVVLGVLFGRALLRERRDWGRFRRLRTTLARQRVMRRWLVENAVVLGGLSAATVYAGWGVIPEALVTAQAWTPVASVRAGIATPAGGLVAVALGAVLVAGLIVPVLLARGRVDEVPAIGDVRALLPRSRGELPYGAGLGIVAGVTEELVFRLGMPAVMVLAGLEPLWAFGLSAAVFGLLHLYQGPAGMAFATVLGVVFTGLYLVSGSILLPIALHVLIDLRTLVLIPVAIGRILDQQPPPRVEQRPPPRVE